MLYEPMNYYYLRLSKEDGDVTDGSLEESCSISSQRVCIHQYLKNNFSMDTHFEEISDDGFSGTNMNRPGMQKLLRLVMEGKVKTIIVRDLSRFARDYLEAGHYLEFVFPAYGVRFISINDNFDSAALGETTGGLDLAIRNLINQMYSRDLSRKIKSAVDLKKLNGEYVYGTAPYGYKKGEKKNTIVIDPPAAYIVKRVFTMAAEGITITQIANQLNEDKVTTPSVYLASVRGKYKTRAVWSYESVRNILINRIYTGDTVPFKSHVVRVGSDKVKQIPEELQQIIPDTHEAIISREMYYQARTVIKSNKKSKPKVSANPFTSLLVCGCCGNRLTKGKEKNKNWLCATARYTKDLGCGNVRMEEETLHDIVLRAITVQCQLVDARISVVRKKSTVAKSKEQIIREEFVKLQREYEKIQTGKMEYYEQYVGDEITKEEYVQCKYSLSVREETLKAQMRLYEEKLDAIKEKLGMGNEYVRNTQQFSDYKEVTQLTPELTKELIKQIVVRPDGHIHIQWNFSNEITNLEKIAQELEDAVAV